MNALKAQVSELEAINFLKKHVATEIDSIMLLEGGEMSKAFSYSLSGKEYVFRINNESESFYKDKFAYENFSNKIIPIPKVFEIGNFKDKFYCISEKAPGQNMDNYDKGIAEKLYPELTDILDNIHDTKLPEGKFGWWDGVGGAHFDTWFSWLTDYGDYLHKSWEEIFKKTVLDEDIIEKCMNEITALKKFIPNERQLVHGDFGGNNAISDGQKITGIIDWGNSCYGDFLYDIAYLEYWFDYWQMEEGFSATIKTHLISKNRNVTDYDERIRCYLIRIGLGVMGFVARSGDEERYNKHRAKIVSFIDGV